jgi:hypothetical protein
MKESIVRVYTDGDDDSDDVFEYVSRGKNGMWGRKLWISIGWISLIQEDLSECVTTFNQSLSRHQGQPNPYHALSFILRVSTGIKIIHYQLARATR